MIQETETNVLLLVCHLHVTLWAKALECIDELIASLQTPGILWRCEDTQEALVRTLHGSAN